MQTATKMIAVDEVSGYRLEPTILREYDIRGVVGQTLTPAAARAIGRAFGTMVRERQGNRVCIGFDGRLSSPELEEAVVEGLIDVGVTVLRIGRGPTPMLYFAVHSLGADGGIMVTGSHNPPEYNGFKMMMGTKPFFGADIQRLGEIAQNAEFSIGHGRAQAVNVTDAYVDRLLRDWTPGKDFSVAWDPGNGAAGEILRRVVDRLPGHHTIINETIDGTFPAHHPDPTVPENLVQLRRSVRDENCDLGIAFDGDGDRIGVVDAKGEIVWGDQLLAILAQDVLRDMPGSTIIADVKASQVLFDHVAACGGNPLMWRTGHSLIKTKMKETGAPLAGEMSGHIFFADRYYGFDDALYAAIRLLGLLAQSARNMEMMRAAFPQVVNTPELRFDCAEDRKFVVVEEVRTRLKKAGADLNAIDGVRVRTRDGWWLLRASNTQAVLVARCESQNEEGLGNLKALLADQLRASGVEPPSDF